ncbi:MAG: hypothetical protein ACLR2E_15025 [Lachnospiraceae bacterium]
MLLLENLHPEDLKKVGKLLKTNKVERVLIPYGDTAENLPELSKAEKVQILKAGKQLCFRRRGWNVWVKCLDHGPKEIWFCIMDLVRPPRKEWTV